MKIMRYLVPFWVVFMGFVTSVQANVPNLNVEIYTIPGCSGCRMAKDTLEERGVSYHEISLQGRPDLYAEMKRRAGGSQEDSMTVPRVFINGQYVGGLSNLDSALDRFLSKNNPNAGE
jgi:glutaredoxin 3